MVIKVGKLVGKPGLTKWSQVHDFTPETDEKINARGRLIAVVSLTINNETNEEAVVETGREALNRLHELYFGTLEENCAIALETTIKSLEAEFEEIEVVAMVIVGQKVYLSTTGKTGVWGKAGEKEGWIISPKTDKQTTLNATIGSKLTLVLGNREFWEGVPLGMIRTALTNFGIDDEEGLGMIGAVLHGGDRSGGEAGVIINIEQNQNSEVAEEEEVKSAPQTAAPQAAIIKPKKEFVWPKLKVHIKWPFKSFKKEIYIPQEKAKKTSRSGIFAGAVFAILTLILVSGGRLRSRQVVKVNGEVNSQIEQLASTFYEAKALAGLNPVRSRQMLEGVKNQLTELQQSKLKDPRLTDIASQMGEVLGTATGIKNVTPEEVVDLSLIRDGMTGARIAISEGKLGIVDVSGSRVIMVDPDKKSGQVAAGKEGVGAVQLIALYPGKTMVWSADKGVVELKPDNPKTVIEKDGEWGNIADMDMFTGNIYLLDTTHGQIWRYNGSETGFSKKQAWLSTDQNVKDAVSMTIDGNVWVLGSSGSIRKFNRGVGEDFNVNGLDKPWSNQSRIYTNEDADSLYILDSGNGRIVIIKKTGEYKQQLVNDSLRNATDMVTDEKKGAVYVVAGSKILEFRVSN